jgi:hypothetical protein
MRHHALAAIALLAAHPAHASAQTVRERLPGWNVTFGVPAGWRVVRNSGRAAALVDTLEASAVFVTASYLATGSEAAAELRAMFADMHYEATAVGAPRDTMISGSRAQLAHFQGSGRAGLVETRVAVLFTPHGTGVTVFGLAPAGGAAALAGIVLRIAASIEAAAPAINAAWLSALVGHWTYIPPPGAAHDSSAAGKAAIDEWLEFDGRQQFTWSSRTVVTVSVPGASPLVAEADRDSGTFTVVGNTLVLRGQSRRRVLDVQLAGDRLSIGGRSYRRKAKGRLRKARSTDPRDRRVRQGPWPHRREPSTMRRSPPR